MLDMSTIKYFLSCVNAMPSQCQYGLKRKIGDEVNNDELREIIRKEIDEPSCVSGYRALWHTLCMEFVFHELVYKHCLKRYVRFETNNGSVIGLRDGLTNHLGPTSVGMSTAMTNSSPMDSQYMAA